MSNLVNTGSIPSLLRPGLIAVVMDMDTYPLECFEFNKKIKSDKAVEISAEMYSAGNAAFKEEGGPISSTGMGQLFQNSVRNRTIGTSVTFTNEMLADNLYPETFPRSTVGMRNSMFQFKNILGASSINNGFNTSNPIYDGQPLFSTGHLLQSGTSSNTFSIPVGLNETSLEDSLIGISLFLSASGMKISYHAEKMIVPPQLQFTAERLLGSKYRTGTANNDINAIYATQMLPKGYAVNHFINDPTQWTLVTNCETGYTYYDRQGIMTDVVTDPSTNNLTCKIWERYSFTNLNWRSTWGSRAI